MSACARYVKLNAHMLIVTLPTWLLLSATLNIIPCLPQLDRRHADDTWQDLRRWINEVVSLCCNSRPIFDSEQFAQVPLIHQSSHFMNPHWFVFIGYLIGFMVWNDLFPCTPELCALPDFLLISPILSPSLSPLSSSSSITTLHLLMLCFGLSVEFRKCRLQMKGDIVRVQGWAATQIWEVCPKPWQLRDSLESLMIVIGCKCETQRVIFIVITMSKWTSP